MSFGRDYPEDYTTVTIVFTTHDANGAPVAPLTAFEAADVTIYKNGSTAKATTNGVTMTSPLNSKTGLHAVIIDTSNDTGDSGFWTTGGGAVYTVVLDPDTETVNSQTVRKPIGDFSIAVSPVNWGRVSAPTTTVGLTGTTIASTQKVDVDTIKTNPVVNGGTVTFASNTTVANTTGAVGSVTGSVGSVTGLTASNLDTTVSSRLASGSYTAPSNLTAAQIATGVWQDTTASDFTTALSVGKSIMNGVTLGTGLTVNDITTKTGFSLSQSFPTNFSSLSIDGSGRVDVIKIAGASQTARDIGASVLLSSGTGTGQLDFTSGVVKANATQILGTAVSTPATAGILDVNLKNIANAAVSASTAQLGVNVVNNAGSAITSAAGIQEVKVASIAAGAVTATAIADGAIDAATFASGALDTVWSTGTRVLTAGTNIQLPSNGLANVTAWTVAITGNITGNLSGSVGSVTTVNDKIGYALTSAYDPAKTAAQAGDAMLADVRKVNNVTVNGTGTSGDPWGP
jgi:hypothetical protein